MENRPEKKPSSPCRPRQAADCTTVVAAARRGWGKRNSELKQCVGVYLEVMSRNSGFGMSRVVVSRPVCGVCLRPSARAVDGCGGGLMKQGCINTVPR